MADKTIKLTLVGEDRSAGKTLRGVGDEAEKAGGRLDGMKVAAGVAAATAGAAIVEFGRQSVEAFRDSEQSQRQLEDAYARFPAVASVPIEALRELNSAIQEKTGADADDLAASQASLAQYQLTGEQIAALTPLLDDYAVKTGKDLPAAAEDLGKAMLGQGRALKDVGIDFQDTGTVTGNFDQVMSGLRTQVGGFATSEAGSAEGALRRLSTEFGDVQEEVGAQLLPVLVQLGEALLVVIDWVQQNSDVLIPLGAAVGVVVGMVLAWQAAQWLLNAALLANPIGIVVVALVALVAGFVAAYNSSETFRNIVDGALQWVKDTASAVGAWFSGPFVDFFRNAGAWVGAQFDGIGQWWTRTVEGLQAAGQRIGDFFTVDVPAFFGRAAEAIGSSFAGVKDFLLQPIRDAVSWINSTFVSGINGFLGTIGISWRVPEIPGFADGGYTGPGGKHQAAGIVHAGEVVWSQEDVAAWGGPQAVDRMRKTPPAGYAGGGIVGSFAGYDPGAAAALQAWAGASGRTWTTTGAGGSRTYAQQWALYLNYLNGGNLAADPRKGLGPHMVPAIAMDLSPRPGENPAARALLPSFGLGLTVPGEPWHVQYLAGRGGGVTAGGAVDFGIGAIIDGLLAKLPGLTPPWDEVLKTIMGKVPEGIIDKVMGLFGFDSGGWMMPGMAGVNRLGQPEAVLTPEESRGLKAGLGRPLDADELAEKVGARVGAAVTDALAAARMKLDARGLLDAVDVELELALSRRF